MTQVFTDEGIVIPVTVIQAGPLSVIQKKTIEVDGYNSLKVAFGILTKEELINLQRVSLKRLGFL